MTYTASTRILVPLGEPELAPEVARVVQRLASPAGAEVTLLRVVIPAGRQAARLDDGAPAIDLAERRVRAELVQAGRALDGLSVRPEVVVGRDVAREILAWLRAHPVEWVVIAARERGGLRRLLVPGVVEAVRRASPAPVLSVHAPRARQPGVVVTHPALGKRPAGAF